MLLPDERAISLYAKAGFDKWPAVTAMGAVGGTCSRLKSTPLTNG
jgi:hypothetical protein